MRPPAILRCLGYYPGSRAWFQVNAFTVNPRTAEPILAKTDHQNGYGGLDQISIYKLSACVNRPSAIILRPVSCIYFKTRCVC